MLFWILKIIFYIPLLIVYPVKVVGRKNLPKKGRVIFSANHQTLNDAVIVGMKINRRLNYMAKAPLFKYKFSNWFLRKMGAYPVHTSSSDLTSVKTTFRLLNNEKAVCIFPEGRRNKTSEDNALKNGVAMFALKTKTPVVPAIFLKKTDAFKFNTLLIGKPLFLHEMEQFKDKRIDRELLEEASKVIAKAIFKLKKDYNNKKNKNK